MSDVQVKEEWRSVSNRLIANGQDPLNLPRFAGLSHEPQG
jgi:hypothetical protein